MNSEYVHYEEELEGFKLQVVNDQYPNHPRRDWETPVEKMICWWRGYNLGDDHNYSEPRDFLLDMIFEHATDEEIRAVYLKQKFTLSDYRRIGVTPDDLRNGLRDRSDWFNFDDVDFPRSLLISPLYVYEHSGITIRCSSFSCPWDSGQAGWVYVTQEDIDREWGGSREQAEKYIKAQVETYAQYLEGDVWGVVVKNPEGDEVESCWGFFGSDYAEEEGKALLKYAVEQDKKDRLAAIHSANPNEFGKL